MVQMKKTLLQAYKVVICSSPMWVNYASRMSKSAALEVVILSLLHSGGLTYLLLTKLLGVGLVLSFAGLFW
jgi:hypothetical protein